MAKKNILIIDDDRDWARLLSDRLEFEGYNVAVAFDTLNGVAQAVKLKPDLILLDIMMPAGGGLMVLKNIRDNSNTFNTSVIVMTGRIEDEIRAQAEKLGISGYVIKPIDSNSFMSKIKDVLQHKK